MEIRVTLAQEDLVWMALQVFQGYEDCLVGKEPPEMCFQHGQELLVHLALMGLWGQRESLELMEVQDYQVTLIYIYVNTNTPPRIYVELLKHYLGKYSQLKVYHYLFLCMGMFDN